MAKTRQTRGFYGRRHGHRLRTRRQALLNNLLPRLAISVDPAVSIEPRSLFPGVTSVDSAQIWLEIGFGGGEHLATLAQKNPNVSFVGCERFVNGIASLLAHIEAHDLLNIRIADADATDLLTALAPASISRLFLLFPDPWPKTRHHKRRFVNRDNLDKIARILGDGAQVRFASDHAGYCAWTLLRFLDHKDFTWTGEIPSDWRIRPDDWPQTRYEANALSKGEGICYFTFERSVRSLSVR